MKSTIRQHDRRRAGTERFRAGAAVLAGTLLLALAACGGAADDDGAPTAEPPAATATASPADDGAPSTIEELNAALAPAQLAAGSVRTELTFGGGAAELAGLAGMAITADTILTPEGATAAMHLMADVDGEALDMLLVDDIFYVNLGEAAGGMFMSLTRDEVAAEADLAGLLEQFDRPNTGAVQEFAADAVTSFEHTTGDGTDIFTVGIDPSKLSANAIATMGMDPSSAATIEEMTIETVVSQADGLPQTSTIRATMQGETLEVVSTFSQWGNVPAMTAPPADLVIPYAEATDTA